MELIPNLHLIEGSRSNIYLWLGNGGPLMVDAGMPKDKDKIIDYLAHIDLDLTEIKAIFLTHADLDHVGAAAFIQARSEAIVYAGSETAELIQRGKSPKHMKWLVQFVIDHFMSYPHMPAESIQVIGDNDNLLEDGIWQALATPGHTTDHFSLYSSVNGILFAGDALNTREDRLQSTPARITADLSAAAISARRLLLLHPAVIACGHGRPLMDYDASVLMMLYRELGEYQSGMAIAEKPGGKL